MITRPVSASGRTAEDPSKEEELEAQFEKIQPLVSEILGHGEFQRSDPEQIEFTAQYVKGRAEQVIYIGNGSDHRSFFCDSEGRVQKIIKDGGSSVSEVTDIDKGLLDRVIALLEAPKKA